MIALGACAMSTPTPRTPFSTAVAVGSAVFGSLMVGVGGYQATAAHVVGAFMLGAEESVTPPPAVHPAESALSMCAWPSDEDAGRFSSSITLHATTSRSSVGTGSTHSPPGLVGACN
jgi:hypothetical protein